MAPSKDGERAERLSNTLFGAKEEGIIIGSASTLTSLRRTKRRAKPAEKPGRSIRVVQTHEQ